MLQAGSREERGASLAELAMFLPVLLILLMGAADIASWSVKYTALTEVVYEATRYASTLPGLEKGSYDMSNASATPQMKLIHERISGLLSGSGLPAEKSVRINYLGAEGNNIVSLEVSTPFDPISVFLQGRMSVTVRSDGPYLFPIEQHGNGLGG